MPELTDNEKEVLANVGGTTASIAYWYFGLNKRDGHCPASATLEQCEIVNRHLKKLCSLGLVEVKATSPTIWALTFTGERLRNTLV
jgi:hypothetical protein